MLIAVTCKEQQLRTRNYFFSEKAVLERIHRSITSALLKELTTNLVFGFIKGFREQQKEQRDRVLV